MSILQEARIKVEYLEDYYRRREAGYHPECEPLAVSEAAAMLPEVLAYAERRERQAIQCKADLLAKSNGVDIQVASYDHVAEFFDQAAKELDADISSWRRIDEDEKDAIQDAILCMNAEYGHDHAEAIKVLRGLIS